MICHTSLGFVRVPRKPITDTELVVNHGSHLSDASKKRLIEDTEDWRPRTGTSQSRSFRILAQITGTENGQYQPQLITALPETVKFPPAETFICSSSCIISCDLCLGVEVRRVFLSSFHSDSVREPVFSLQCCSFFFLYSLISFLQNKPMRAVPERSKHVLVCLL